MSLLKQLLISVSLAILIILGGTLWLSVESARSYLNTQLQSQTDSAATSLALTLSQPSNQDPVTQELIIMAQFDSGQFSQISLTDPQGSLLLTRQSEAGKSQAPTWFTNWLPIAVAESAAQVSDGWRQVGSLHLRADATYAQDTLWQSFTRLVAWVVGAGVLWALFVVFLMNWLRRVLHKEVTEQLQALVGQGTTAAVSPVQRKTTFAELSEVTEALASARESIMATTDEQNAKIQLLEVELNQDAVTGLVNRQYFINELRRQLENAQSSAGWLFIFRQRDLAEINRVMARSHVDEWLRSLSQQLQDLVQQYQPQGQIELARLNGSDFVMMAALPEKEMHELISQAQVLLRQQRIQLPNGEFCRWALAQTDYQAGQLLTHVLGRLDQALMRAESAGHNIVEKITAEQADAQVDQPRGGETQWRNLIQEAIVQKGFSLDVQPQPNSLGVWYDATLLLHPTHTAHDTLSGYQFMPVATRLGLSGECDLRAFELALKWLQTHEEQRLVVRVSLSSITQDSFCREVTQRFALADRSVTTRLSVELDAYALQSEPVRVTEFMRRLHEHGVWLGVRRLLSLPRVLLELTTFKTDYARVLTSEVQELEMKAGGLVLLRSTLEICNLTNTTFLLDGDASSLSHETQFLLQECGIIH